MLSCKHQVLLLRWYSRHVAPSSKSEHTDDVSMLLGKYCMYVDEGD